MHGKCRPKREKLEAFPAGHLRRSENWPKWLVASANDCIPTQKLSSWPCYSAKARGLCGQSKSVSRRGHCSAKDCCPASNAYERGHADVGHQGQKKRRQHARKAAPVITPAYYKEGLVRFTEKRPQMHQPWLKERRSWWVVVHPKRTNCSTFYL